MSQIDRDRYREAIRRMDRAREAFGDPVTVTIVGGAGAVQTRVAERAADQIDGQAIGRLLVQKGIVTRDEVEKALADEAEGEVARIAAALGVSI